MNDRTGLSESSALKLQAYALGAVTQRNMPNHASVSICGTLQTL
jgi:hypothetical protein